MKRGEYISKKIEVICQWCGKKFKIEPWRIKTINYCSRGCSGKAHSENMRGEDYWNWQGGKTEILYPLEWTAELREFIRERDGNTCQLCGKTKKEENRNLSVHHIDYNKQNCNPKNLIALCGGCNVKVNYNRASWGFIFLWDKLWEDQITDEGAISALNGIFEKYGNGMNLIGEMMKLNSIKNSSDTSVELEHKNGAKTTLPPEATLKNVNINNLEEVKGSVETVADLTEVIENKGKTILYG